MSLSRILNDDPAPATSMAGAPRPGPADPALASPASTAHTASRSPVEPLAGDAHAHARRGYPPPPPAHQGGWSKDPYTAEWVHADAGPARRNGDYFPERAQAHSPHDARNANANYRETEAEGPSRKRRREDEEDEGRAVEARPSRVSVSLDGIWYWCSYGIAEWDT